MRNHALWIVGFLGGLLLAVPSAHAAPENTAPPATTPVTTAPPARAATPMPVPERSAAPVVPTPIRPTSTEKGHKMAQAKRLLWWGAGFSIGGAVIVGIGGGLLGRCFSQDGNPDDCGTLGYSVLGVGFLVILASAPVWIVGLVKKSKAERTDGSRKILPKSRKVVDLAHRRYYRRLIRRSGPPAVPVLTYGVRF